jgi:hypothetical protein
MPALEVGRFIAGAFLVGWPLAIWLCYRARIEKKDFLNSRKRPDIIVLGDATVSGCATENFQPESGLASLRDILLIELKRGGSTIERENVFQLDGYVQDLLKSGHIEGTPFIHAFVVGHKVNPKVEPAREIGPMGQTRARILAVTYDRLVRSAEMRLFGLRKRLNERYAELTGQDLLARLGEGGQLPLLNS